MRCWGMSLHGAWVRHHTATHTAASTATHIATHTTAHTALDALLRDVAAWHTGATYSATY